MYNRSKYYRSDPHYNKFYKKMYYHNNHYYPDYYFADFDINHHNYKYIPDREYINNKDYKEGFGYLSNNINKLLFIIIIIFLIYILLL